jgi:hypothetical protein
LFRFRIVFCLDLLVVEEIFLLAFMLHDLKALAVKGIFILLSSNVMDNDIQGFVRA